MRDILKSPRIAEIKHNRRVRKVRWIIIFFVLFVCLIGALAYYSSNSHFTINKITVVGNSTINTEDIESHVQNGISGKYIYLFSRANTFIYPRKRIYNDLIGNFPRIETLSVYRDDWNTLVILIVERSGTSLYCGETIPKTAEDVGENCYFINGDGFIFDKAPYFSGNIYFKYYFKIDNNMANPIGNQVLTKDRFQELSSFVDGISKLGFKPVYLSENANGNYSLSLNHGLSSTNPEIIFKDGNDLETILSNLSTAMTKREFANEINSKYDSLLYIDLRFNNKVLYKFNS